MILWCICKELSCFTGVLYTGTADGKIFAIRNRSLSLLTRTGIKHNLCGTPEYEPQCGRPKGMKIGADGNLYVVDSYKGLLKVDTATGNIETLVSNKQGIVIFHWCL